MVICICKRATDRDVAEAITGGARSVDDIAEACGAGTGCGQCREFLHDLLDEAGTGCGANGSSCPDCPGRSLPIAS